MPAFYSFFCFAYIVYKISTNHCLIPPVGNEMYMYCQSPLIISHKSDLRGEVLSICVDVTCAKLSAIIDKDLQGML